MGAGEVGNQPKVNRNRWLCVEIIVFFFFFLNIYLFRWLCRVLTAALGIFFFLSFFLVVACRIFSCDVLALSSLSRDQTLGPLHWEIGVPAIGPLGKS